MNLFIDEEIAAKIKRRMLQIWLHSYIYYKLGKNIITDRMWDSWANELVELKEKYPSEFKSIKHHEIFEDFDGSTGYYLATSATRHLKAKAHFLLKEK